MQKGQVIKTYNSFYYVNPENRDMESELIPCKLRGRFKKERCRVVTGDMVEFNLLEDGSGIIEELLPRKSLLLRPAVANVDQVFLTFAAAQPDLHPLLLNRFLVLSEWSEIPQVVICITKMDLLPEEKRENFLADYEAIGYPVLKVSSQEGWGLQQVKDALAGKTTVFAGPSGVGKSTLLNAVEPGFSLTTGRISDKIKRGRHTTRVAQFLPWPEGGYVVDTPGFSVTELETIDQNSLGSYFPEMREYIGKCRYNTCTHSHEPECAVKEALAQGKIHQDRYEAYLNILQEIASGKKEY